jgi:hypothetical protein
VGGGRCWFVGSVGQCRSSVAHTEEGKGKGGLSDWELFLGVCVCVT